MGSYGQLQPAWGPHKRQACTSPSCRCLVYSHEHGGCYTSEQSTVSLWVGHSEILRHNLQQDQWESSPPFPSWTPVGEDSHLSRPTPSRVSQSLQTPTSRVSQSLQNPLQGLPEVPSHRLSNPVAIRLPNMSC